MRFKHFQKLEADSHPFFCTDIFGSPICNSSDEVNTVLLHLLMPVFQDRGQPWKQVLNRRCHLLHTNHVHNRFQSAQNGPKYLRIFFSEVFVENHTQVPHQLFLSTRFHHYSNPGNEISSLLTHPSRLIIQTPLDNTAHLGQVQFSSPSKCVNHNTKSVQQNFCIVARLFLECVQNTIDKLLFEAMINVCRTILCKNFLNGLHCHLTERFRLVFQFVHNSADNVTTTNFVGDLNCCFNKLLIVSSFKGHSPNPEVSRKFRKNFFLNVVSFYAISCDTLFNHLQDNLLHFFICSRKFSYEDCHHLLRVIVGVVGIHQRNDIANRLKERCQCLTSMSFDPLPKRT
mmetsp:Transcript_34549/g.83586  ORF Transcript_34549/g.83586 Transcript_34549/m.83586 type:complete len:343 (+) Transcript_34549:948-1976(+)